MKTMPELINNLMNHHFCIKGKTKEEILKCLDIASEKHIIFDEKFDWNFLFAEDVEDLKRFIIFDSLNNWTYLRWNVWNFEETKKMTSKLSKALNTEVNYFFIDPWISTLRWIIAKDGKLIRTYFESHETIVEESGEFSLEKEIRDRIVTEEGKTEFWEDKYWELYKEMNLPITALNEKKEIDSIIGEIN